MGRRLSRWVQVTLVLLLPGPALLAQHAGHAGSTSPGHIGGAFHARPSPSFSGTPHFAPPVPQIGRSGHWPSWTPTYPARDGRGGVGYRRHYPTVYAAYPWLGAFPYYGLPLGYDASYGDDWQDEQAPPQQAEYGVPPASDYAPEAPDAEMAANGPSPYRPAYGVPAETAPPHAQPATTLIFKDGRTPVQVHNYALTGSTLYGLDEESHQEIPLSQLDVPATVEANRKTGVDFALPISR